MSAPSLRLHSRLGSRQSFLSLVAAAAIVPWITGCKAADAKLGCRDACSRMDACGADTMASCMYGCADMRDIMDDHVFEALGNCMIDASCDELISSNDGPPQHCFTAALEKGNRDAFEGFGHALCDKMVACFNGFDRHACYADMAVALDGGSSGDDDGLGDMTFMTLIAEDKLYCLTDCVNDVSCNALANDGDIVGPCMQPCGLNFDDDGSNAEVKQSITPDDCRRLCSRLVECDPSEDHYACTQACETLIDYGRPQVLEATAECLETEECRLLAVGDGPDYCLQQAIFYAPPNAAGPVIDALCSQVANCSEGYISYDQCWTDMTMTGSPDGGPSMLAFAVFEDSTVQCMSDCVNRLSCSSFAQTDEDPVGACGWECGIGAFM